MLKFEGPGDPGSGPRAVQSRPEQPQSGPRAAPRRPPKLHVWTSFVVPDSVVDHVGTVKVHEAL